jgi:hypothetical protein
MSNIIHQGLEYYACANAGDDRHEDYCESIILDESYQAKRSYLISTLAWDLGGQRPECDTCEEVYADNYSG